MKPMKYKVRAGTIDSGKKYECKIAALLSLRCVLHPEDMWISSNADGVGAFDDIVLHQGNKTFMLQLKHKDDPKPLQERDFLAPKGDFALKKYYRDIIKLRDCITCQPKKPEIIKYLGDFNDIYFVLFTNRDCNFLEETYDAFPHLNTGTSVYKLDAIEIADLSSDDSFNNVYLLPNQIHAKNIDKQIAKEIQKLTEHYKIEHLNIKQIAETFTKYITDWAEGLLGGHYCLTKRDVICKLTELFVSQYEVELNDEEFTFYTTEKKHVWNNVLQDEILTVVDFAENIYRFLLEYIGSEIKNFCREPPKFWKAQFSEQKQTEFYEEYNDLKTHMLKLVGNRGKIRFMDVYKCLWMDKRVPLLLKIKKQYQYLNILRILKLSNYGYKIVIINKCSEVLIAPNNDEKIKRFSTAHDINQESKRRLLQLEVKLQGRSSVTLEKLVDEDMLQYITSHDVINILLEKFSIGNDLNPLPDYFIPRNVSRVFFLSKALYRVQNEIFLVEGTFDKHFEILSINNRNVHQLENIDVNNLSNGGIVFSSKSVSCETIEQLKSTQRPVHHLKIHDEIHLEWKASFGSVKNLRKFQVYLDEIVEGNIANKFDFLVNIVSAVPGMGKSVLMDYVALRAPTDKWVLKIDLNGHQKYYKSNACKVSTTKAEEHLEYFKNTLLNQHNCNTKLANVVFKKLSKSKDVIVLLDGFDEVSLCNKNEVTNIAKSLHSKDYSVWLTTRPHMNSHLQKEFDTFSMTLKSFSVNNQKQFLTNYFCANIEKLNVNSKKLVEGFVEKLLKASEKNLNDWDSEFTGIPLQTKLLADVFKDECVNYVSKEGASNFNEHFDLLYLYQNFIDKKVDILCDRFGVGAEDTHSTLKENQSLFALRVLFSQHKNLLGYERITKKLNDYYVNQLDRIQLLQREGVVTVDSDFNVNFVHRTYGEYLAAHWLAENLNSSDQPQKEFARILIKERFTQDYKFLFGLFDRILSKNFPIHLAVINNKDEEALERLNSNPEEVTTVDEGGRSILHVIALYSVQFPTLFKEFRHPYIINYKALQFLESKVFESDKMLRIAETILNHGEFKNEMDMLGYNPLDYALANRSLTVADKISAKFTTSTVNANIALKFKKDYLISCALLSYAPLFNVLLPYFMTKDLLFTNVHGNELVTLYVKNANSIHSSGNNTEDVKLRITYFNYNYYEQYKDKTILEYLQPESNNSSNWLWNTITYSDIRFAICFGSEKNVDNLLAKGANINQQDTDYNTPLHYAVLHKKPKMVDKILKKNPDLNKQNFNKNTPLHLAFTTTNTDSSLALFFANNKTNKIVNKLIAKKADANIKNNDDITPPHLAVENNKYDWVKLFIDSGADINLQDGNGSGALHLAAIRDYNEILTVILNSGRNFDVNLRDNEGETPLFCAIRNNNIVTTKLLIDKGAEVNVQDRYGGTVLHLAATHGYNEILREILNNNKDIDINLEDNYGWTPFSCALLNNNIETIEILTVAGASTDVLDEKGKSLLKFAMVGGHNNILNDVLVNGSSIDINKKDKDGRTPLFYEVQNNDMNKVTRLLRIEARLDVPDKNGSTILHLLADSSSMDFNDTLIRILNKNLVKIDGNIQDNDGRTPLFYAVKRNKRNTVKLFISHGAKVFIQDKNGASPLHLIASRGYNDVLSAILIDGHNIDVNIEDDDGRTPLFYASRDNQKNTIKLLLDKGADITIQNCQGQTAFDVATDHSCKEILSKYKN